MKKISGHPVDPENPTESLTHRELEVFQLIGKGLKTGEIAQELSLSVKTIGTYRTIIKTKLGMRHSAELVRTTIKWTESQSGIPEGT